MGFYIVPEGTSDRTAVQYNSEHQEFDIMVNGKRIHTMNPAQFSFFCHTIEPAQELRYQAEDVVQKYSCQVCQRNEGWLRYPHHLHTAGNSWTCCECLGHGYNERGVCTLLPASNILY